MIVSLSSRLYLLALISIGVFRSVVCCFAATNDSIRISGRVLDAFSHEVLDSVRIDVRQKEGIAGKEFAFYTFDLNAEVRAAYDLALEAAPPEYGYEFLLPSAGTYVFSFSRKGYTPQEITVRIPSRRYGRSTKEWHPKDVLLQRFRERTLNEAVVRATKVMMVHRGDTVVYDADCFQLSQGSMLDDLISRMPGLEIREGGRIFYKGNPLSSLLVNGKDFFKGDPAIALQNLPAYTVKEIKVFHTEEAGERFARFRKDTSGSPNTIDVVLRKAYSHGWITNYELAGGTALKGKAIDTGKYLGRLFALHYGDRSRLGVFGNVNNVNDVQTAGFDGSWNGERQNEGITETAWGGLLYSIDTRDRRTGYSLELHAKHTADDVVRQVSSTSFLGSSDAYHRSTATAKQGTTHLTLDNTLQWKGMEAELKINAKAFYTDCHSDSHVRSAQFSADPSDTYRGASVDSVFAAPGSSRLAALLTNRLEQSEILDRHAWTQSATVGFDFREPLLGNHGSIKAYSEAGGKRKHLFEHYDLRYRPDRGLADDYRNRYTTTPQDTYRFSAEFNYSFDNMLGEATAKWLGLSLGYRPDVCHTHGDRLLYDLHTLPDSGCSPLGTLPSMEGWRMLCLNAGDSYTMQSIAQDHRLLTRVSVGMPVRKHGMLSLCPQLQFLRNRYDDTRSPAGIRRAYTFFLPKAEWRRMTMTQLEGVQDRMHLFILTYSLDRTAPDASLLLDIRDASNPLSISLGNDALKACETHTLTANWLYTRDSRECDFNLQADYCRTNHAVAMGCDYDTRTGVYTFRPQNVDGNWQAVVATTFGHPLDKNRVWRVYADLRGEYRNAVDMLDGQLSEVHNLNVNLSTQLSCRLGKKGSVSVWAVPKWQHATSGRTGFQTRNTWEVGYGPTLTYKPVRDAHFQTSFRIYQRRGYDDDSMNDDSFIWNASFSYSFDFRRSSYHSSSSGADGGSIRKTGTGKRPWTVSLTAQDILRQLSNTRRVLNAQGITETWYNTVPSYVMLHVFYRFSKSPQKK